MPAATQPTQSSAQPVGTGATTRPGTWLSAGWKHRRLISRLALRELQVQYRGSLLGAAWTVLLPLLMLSVYTFVFSTLLSRRWGDAEGTGSFALRLFCGLILFQAFAKALNRGPILVRSKAGYVKNVLFPLEVLPYVTLLPILVEVAISFVLLLSFQIVVDGIPAPTTVFLPLLLVPLCCGTLGIMWFLSSLGVYLRDIQQIIGVATTALMFLSAVFYPLSVIPEKYQIVIKANPLAMLIEQARALMFTPDNIHWLWILALALGSMVFAEICFRWFQRTREGFADVL